MIVAKDTPKNRIIIDKIADIEVDLQMFQRTMTDEEFDKEMEKLQKLYREIE